MDFDRDIMHLLIPMLSLSNDNLGTEVVPPRPLSFDRVNEGKSPVSDALLFTLPFELLGQILESLPRSSLACLALVCRDCRQIARSRQFASITLDYSDHSVALVEKLLAEATIRVGSYGGSKNISQSLGVCIRRITVATHPVWVAARHNIALKDKFLALSERTRARRLANASKHFFDVYLPKIQLLLGSKIVLPHLESLDWRDKIALPRSFFERLPSTSIQHLRLFRVKVSEAFEINLPRPSKGWPLRTLYMEVVSGFDGDKPNTSLMCASILRLCAPTLESLTWRTFLIEDEHHSFATYTMESTPQFPRLRSLKLQTVLFSDYSMLDALLEGDLRELEVDLGHDSLYSEFFEQRGTMPALTTLVWDGKIKADQSLSFLRANTQLSKLSFQWEAPGVFLETRLLPLLTKSFRHLTSLSLKWEGDSIPGSALEAISSLEILQQLHLSAGHQHGWRYSWFIDHALMRSRLKKLTSLRRMAFTRDIYDNEVEWSAPERYYEDRFHNDLDLDADEDEWETWHCESASKTDKLSGSHRTRLMMLQACCPKRGTMRWKFQIWNGYTSDSSACEFQGRMNRRVVAPMPSLYPKRETNGGRIYGRCLGGRRYRKVSVAATASNRLTVGLIGDARSMGM